MRYRSRGVFRLAVSACRLHAKNPIHATRDVPTTGDLTFTGLSPSMARLSRGLQFRSSVDVGSPHSTFPNLHRSDSVCSCSRFTRRYSGNRDCFLFLRLLRCFSSAGSLTFRYGITYWAMSGSPIRKSVGLSILAAYHGLSQLVTSFVGTRA